MGDEIHLQVQSIARLPGRSFQTVWRMGRLVLCVSWGPAPHSMSTSRSPIRSGMVLDRGLLRVEEQKKTLHTSYRQTWWHTDEGAFLERALEGNSGVRRRSRRVRAEVQNDDRVEIQNESGDGAEDDPTQSPSGPDSRFPRVFNTTAYGHER